MNDYKKKIEHLQLLPNDIHCKNFIKILHFDFWSDDERLFFIWMYDKMIIEKMDFDNRSSAQNDNLERFFEILS